MKRRYRFPVSQQANLLGLEWKKIGHYALGRMDREEEAAHRTAFFGPEHRSGYNWSAAGGGEFATADRFLQYLAHEVAGSQGSWYEQYLSEREFGSQLEEVLALRIAEAEIALVEFLGLHPDRYRFYGRDLASGQEVLYSPHDYLDHWRPPLRPTSDTCLMQVYRLSLKAVSAEIPEAVVLGTPTLFSGQELRSRALTCLRLMPGGLVASRLEKKIWAHAHWMDFCVDMPVPSEAYLQAVARWEEYLGREFEDSFSLPGLLHEVEMTEALVDNLVADIAEAPIAVPEFEWVLETLWNEQPRVSLWGRTPASLARYLCTQDMLVKVEEKLKRGGHARMLPPNVLMVRALDPA